MKECPRGRNDCIATPSATRPDRRNYHRFNRFGLHAYQLREHQTNRVTNIFLYFNRECHGLSAQASRRRKSRMTDKNRQYTDQN